MFVDWCFKLQSPLFKSTIHSAGPQKLILDGCWILKLLQPSRVHAPKLTQTTWQLHPTTSILVAHTTAQHITSPAKDDLCLTHPSHVDVLSVALCPLLHDLRNLAVQCIMPSSSSSNQQGQPGANTRTRQTDAAAVADGWQVLQQQGKGGVQGTNTDVVL